LTKAYVKVFAKTIHGNVVFFKDGYSDIRGQFDYATMLLDNNENVQSFVLLVNSLNNGNAIIECKPPKFLEVVEVVEKELVDTGYFESRNIVKESKMMKSKKRETKMTECEEDFAFANFD
jgi:hypothetical protein